MRQEIINWWEQSKDDFEKAEGLFTLKKFDGVTFYCQQAVEKADVAGEAPFKLYGPEKAENYLKKSRRFLSWLGNQIK